MDFEESISFVTKSLQTVIELPTTSRLHTLGSKGNQPKWCLNNKWYKADYLGYEGFSEAVCSTLLKHSNIDSYIPYRSVLISEGKRVFRGCVSNDFGTLLSGESILLVLPEEYNVFINTAPTLEANVEIFCKGVEKIFGVDIRSKFVSMLMFDFLVGNEDRILRNFGLIEQNSKYYFAPLFDNGLSLLADTSSNERLHSFEEILFKPFNTTYTETFSYLRSQEPLTLDAVAIFSDIQSIPYYEDCMIGVYNLLMKSLETHKGVLWRDTKL